MFSKNLNNLNNKYFELMRFPEFILISCKNVNRFVYLESTKMFVYSKKLKIGGKNYIKLILS